MLSNYRGKVYYVPFVLPENWMLGGAHILGLLCSIALFVAAGLQSWQVTDITVDAGRNQDPRSVSAELTFGLRDMHIFYCYDFEHSTKAYCGTVDVLYSGCNHADPWCYSHRPTSSVAVLLVFSGIIMLLTSASTIVRVSALPIGLLVGCFLCSLALFIFKARIPYSPGYKLEEWYTNGEVKSHHSSGYLLPIIVVAVQMLSCVLSLVGYVVSRPKEDTSEAENAARQEVFDEFSKRLDKRMGRPLPIVSE